MVFTQGVQDLQRQVALPGSALIASSFRLGVPRYQPLASLRPKMAAIHPVLMVRTDHSHHSCRQIRYNR